jgi:hypothetical protein
MLFGIKPGVWLTSLCLLVAGANRVAHAQDGALDPTFGVTGLVRTDVMGLQEDAYAVAVDASGRPIVAGRVAGSGASRFALARYTSGGLLAPSFGAGGTVLRYGVALQPPADLSISASGDRPNTANQGDNQASITTNVGGNRR